MSIAGPLSGITVVDLTRVLAGPICTLLLSDLGARVIKVEQPDGGDLARSLGPWFNGKSGYLLSVNRGKESIALDLKDAGDLAILHRLLARADVLVENFRPGVMEKLGLGWHDLRARYPRLVYAATSGFGHTGPYANRGAFDLVAQAMGGVMSVTGHPGTPPTRVGTSIGDLAAGLFTAVGVNAALVHRATSGEGMKIDVAMLDCQVALSENALVRHFAGETPGPLGARHPAIAPFDAFPTKDRHIIIAIGGDAAFRKLCETIECPATAADPEFATNALRVEHQQRLKDALSAVLAARPAGEWLTLLEGAGLPCGPINTMAEVVADAQVAARNMLVEVDDPVAGRVTLFGCPIKMSAFDDPHVRATAPELDGDRARILKDLREDPQEAAMSRYPTTPLTGIGPSDLGWLAGSWLGHNGPDAVEEHWSRLAGDTLVGMFRWVKDGRVFFYELATIEREGAAVFLRIKHFSPKLVGWEEKDRACEFVLVHLHGEEAAFLEMDEPQARWAIYRREGPDRLVSYFTRAGEPITETGLFAYARRGIGGRS